MAGASPLFSAPNSMTVDKEDPVYPMIHEPTEHLGLAQALATSSHPNGLLM